MSSSMRRRVGARSVLRATATMVTGSGMRLSSSALAGESVLRPLAVQSAS